MSTEEQRRLGSAFAEGGARYARLRPTYPREAVAWALATAPAGTVADVGAGTGKLTGTLLALGREVVAIDPSSDMLDELRTARPALDVRAGTGERTGLDDASVAAVVYGQAWHWVDPVAASAEAARILRPGGSLALLWDLMDTTDPATAAYNAAMHVLDAEVAEHTDSAADVTAVFADHEHRTFRWRWRLTTRALADLVTTRSYYLARPEEDRARIRTAVADAVTHHFGPLGDTPVVLPHVTEVHRFIRA